MKTGSALKKKSKMSRQEKGEALQGYLFVAPYLIAFVIFTGIPFVYAFVLSFMNVKYNRMDTAKLIGLDNFIKILKDTDSLSALGKSGLYSLIYVPLIMILGFVFAYILNKKVYFEKAGRAMIFLPYISNMMAIAIAVTMLFNVEGVFGKLYTALGMDRSFFQSQNTALVAVVCVAVWKGIGLNMLIFLGALQGIPAELLEAADIDGATAWEKIKNVTIPSISPTTFFLATSSLITSLQNYTVIAGLTEGGPGKATTTISVRIINLAFGGSYRTSYASALALIVFAVCMVITFIQWRGQKKWVDYD